MRIRAIAAAALVALCVVGGAQAKGPDLARVCGASGCTTVRGIAAVQGLLDWMRPTFMVADTPRPAPFYRITLRDHGQPVMRLLYVPSRQRMRVWQPAPYPFAPGSQHPYWRSVSARGADLLENAVARLKPSALRAPGDKDLLEVLAGPAAGPAVDVAA
jgi:hypothetical protein